MKIPAESNSMAYVQRACYSSLKVIRSLLDSSWNYRIHNGNNKTNSSAPNHFTIFVIKVSVSLYLCVN